MKSRKTKSFSREELNIEIEKELKAFRDRVVSNLNLEAQIAHSKNQFGYESKLDELIRSVYQIQI